MNKSFKVALAAAAAITAGSASAATATTTFPVTAAVVANCITTATAMAFGTYLPGNGNVLQTSAVSVRCTSGTAYTVVLNAGNVSSSEPRSPPDAWPMAHCPCSYTLFRDAARTLNSGITAGTDTLAGSGSGMGAVATAFTVYVTIPDSGANLGGDYCRRYILTTRSRSTSCIESTVSRRILMQLCNRHCAASAGAGAALAITCGDSHCSQQLPVDHSNDGVWHLYAGCWQ